MTDMYAEADYLRGPFVQALECKICTGSMNLIDDILSDPSVQTDTLAVIQTACELFVFKDACVGFANGLGPLVF